MISTVGTKIFLQCYTDYVHRVKQEQSIPFESLSPFKSRVLTASGAPLKFTPMSNAQPLNAQQIAHFKLNGYLVLKNVFDEATLEAWRRQIWRALDGSLEDPATWPRETSGLDGYEYDPPNSALVHHPNMMSIIDQLSGGHFVAGDGIPIIRWPEPERTFEIPQTGHIDAYGGRWLPFMIGATTYLYDVEPGGGALIYWPGSHHAAHRYFLEYPSHVDGSFLEIEGFSWDVFCDNPTTGGREFTANAGDVVLWHSYLTHNGSENTSHSPRFALFARWNHEKHLEQDFRYEIPEDLWKYWAI